MNLLVTGAGRTTSGYLGCSENIFEIGYGGRNEARVSSFFHSCL